MTHAVRGCVSRISHTSHRDFDWTEDDTDAQGNFIPGSVSQWNNLVEVSSCVCIVGLRCDAAVTRVSLVAVCQYV